MILTDLQLALAQRLPGRTVQVSGPSKLSIQDTDVGIEVASVGGLDMIGVHYGSSVMSFRGRVPGAAANRILSYLYGRGILPKPERKKRATRPKADRAEVGQFLRDLHERLGTWNLVGRKLKTRAFRQLSQLANEDPSRPVISAEKFQAWKDLGNA